MLRRASRRLNDQLAKSSGSCDLLKIRPDRSRAPSGRVDLRGKPEFLVRPVHIGDLLPPETSRRVPAVGSFTQQILDVEGSAHGANEPGRGSRALEKAGQGSSPVPEGVAQKLNDGVDVRRSAMRLVEPPSLTEQTAAGSAAVPRRGGDRRSRGTLRHRSSDEPASCAARPGSSTGSSGRRPTRSTTNLTAPR